jgi:hypothetical protein
LGFDGAAVFGAGARAQAVLRIPADVDRLGDVDGGEVEVSAGVEFERAAAADVGAGQRAGRSDCL